MTFIPYNKPPAVDLRRHVSIKLMPEVRNILRVYCLRRDLSIQEIFEEFAERLVADDPYLNRIVDDLVKSKRQKYIREISSADAESLFDLIENESPF